MNAPAESSDGDRLVNEIIASYLEAEAAGRQPDRAEILARHPDLAGELRAFFADNDGMRHMAKPAEKPEEKASSGRYNPAQAETLAPDQTPSAGPGTRPGCPAPAGPR